MKWCSASLIIREMQIKTTVMYHFTWIRMTIIKNASNNAGEGGEEKGTNLNCWWEYKLIQPWWRTVWRFLKKPKGRTAIWLSNTTTGHIPWENHNSKRYTHPDAYCSTIYKSQGMEVTLISMYWWMDKEDVVHIFNGILLSYKMEWNWVICGNVVGSRDCHIEWSKSEKDKCRMISLVCGI